MMVMNLSIGNLWDYIEEHYDEQADWLQSPLCHRLFLLLLGKVFDVASVKYSVLRTSPHGGTLTNTTCPLRQIAVNNCSGVE